MSVSLRSISSFSTSMLALSLLALATTPAVSFGHDSPIHSLPVQPQPKVKHYSAESPTDAGAARSQLEGDLKKVNGLLSGEGVGVAELEQVHKISYSLEAAMETLLKEERTNEKEKLAAAIEELHLSSETHDVEKSREAFGRVQSALKEVPKE